MSCTRHPATLIPAVILYNKWLLTWGGFPYPVALTLWHMAFCSTLAFGIIKLGFVQPIDMSAELYLKWVHSILLSKVAHG